MGYSRCILTPRRWYFDRDALLDGEGDEGGSQDLTGDEQEGREDGNGHDQVRSLLAIAISAHSQSGECVHGLGSGR